ncbi:hypothetical protein BJ138DRAFT_1114047 [Hygrophoropsis aurantiaca]|uniref:Uncharacterized protein n=1 Tax=Hygrophoropsis aurantiaca TaxID=72124 RepID=A0ACB8ABM0_9AGAM|nr:hypothetical protein BJ138DRAFT_1114047 [Hygrophoropsis aurantiaca]
MAQPTGSDGGAGGGDGGGGSGNSGGGNGGTSSTLYLFTFLATLFVLLLVSSAIILRSFILRRRFRRRVEEALANGLFLDLPPPPGPPIRALGEKPKLFDRWVVPATDGIARGQIIGDEKSNWAWETLMPVSAHMVKPPKSSSSNSSTLSSSTPAPGPSPPPSRLTRLLPFSFSRGRARSQSQPQTPSPPRIPSSPMLVPSGPSSPTRTATAAETRVAVSVLIAMPSPSRPLLYGGKGKEIAASNESPASGLAHGPGSGTGQRWDDGEREGEMPDVVFGLAEVPYKRFGVGDDDTARRPT